MKELHRFASASYYSVLLIFRSLGARTSGSLLFEQSIASMQRCFIVRCGYLLWQTLREIQEKETSFTFWECTHQEEEKDALHFVSCSYCYLSRKPRRFNRQCNHRSAPAIKTISVLLFLHKFKSAQGVLHLWICSWDQMVGCLVSEPQNWWVKNTLETNAQIAIEWRSSHQTSCFLSIERLPSYWSDTLS